MKSARLWELALWLRKNRVVLMTGRDRITASSAVRQAAKRAEKREKRAAKAAKALND